MNCLGALKSGTVRSKYNSEYSISPTWAIDYDLDTCRTYVKNIHGIDLENSSHIIQADVIGLNIKQLEGCDGFAFGFPCNDFSLVGETKGLNGKFGPLYTYVLIFNLDYSSRILSG